MERPDGHCESDTDWFALSNSPVYQGDRSLLSMGSLTDFQLANDQYLVNRDSLDLIAYQTAAKERIRWLSIRLAEALEQIEINKTVMKGLEYGYQG